MAAKRCSLLLALLLVVLFFGAVFDRVDANKGKRGRRTVRRSADIGGVNAASSLTTPLPPNTIHGAAYGCAVPFYPCGDYKPFAKVPASFQFKPLGVTVWPPVAIVRGSPSAAETTALLAAKAAFQNPAALAGWTKATPTCSWKYVGCTLVGGKPSVTVLALGGLNLGGGTSTWKGQNPAWDGPKGMFGKKGGTKLSEGLTKPFAAGLASLPNLKYLDLSYNAFLNSILPPKLPKSLTHFWADNSLLVGRVPAGYNQLKVFSVVRNMLVGVVPDIAGFVGKENYFHYIKPGSPVKLANIAHNCLIGSATGYKAPNQWANPPKTTTSGDKGWLGNPCYLFCDVAIYENKKTYPGPCLGDGICIKGCNPSFFKKGKCEEKLVKDGGKDPEAERQTVCYCDPGFNWHTDHKCNAG